MQSVVVSVTFDCAPGVVQLVTYVKAIFIANYAATGIHSLSMNAHTQR